MILQARPLRRWAAVATAVVLLAIGVAGWTAADGGTPPIRVEGHLIQVVDGPKNDQRITLDTTFFHPHGHGRVPTVLFAHGFGGSEQSVRADAERLARAGFAVLTWSARGFGRSTGQIALDSPDYEVKDTRQLIDWLSHRPDVLLDRPGDPRVGMAGESYGGAIALLTAAYDSRVDAIAPMITWHDLAGALFPNAVIRATGSASSGAGRPADGVFKKLWAGIFFTGTAGDGGPAGPPTDRTTPCGRFLPSLCDMYEKVAESGRPTQEAIATLRRSSSSTVQDRIKVPTLLVQGQADSLFPLDQADANARAIEANGAPVSVVWFQGGHDGGDSETERVRALVTDWFDRWLRRFGRTGHSDDTDAGFTVTRTGGIDSTSQQVVIRAASARTYPGFHPDGAPLHFRARCRPSTTRQEALPRRSRHCQGSAR